MDLFLAICEALGIGLAAGIGGPLAALFVVVMAGLETGLDPAGTDWEFVGEPWFAAVAFALSVAAFYWRRGDRSPRVPMAAAGVLALFAAAAAAAGEGESVALGILAAALGAALAVAIAGDVLEGAARRAGTGGSDAGSTVATLELIFGLAGVGVAALALFVPPVALAVAVALLVVGAGRRRRAGEKYEGLRILR